MTPLHVRFTGLELDPVRLRDRCRHGVIPPGWQRYHFPLVEEMYPVNKMNRWLHNNIEGEWAVYCTFRGQQRVMVLAFEHDFDAMTFLMADGKTQAFKN